MARKKGASLNEEAKTGAGAEMPLRVGGAYDLVVLGQDPGALFAAVLARREGLSVLIIPGVDHATRFAESVGITDCEPNLAPAFGDRSEWARPFLPAIAASGFRAPLGRDRNFSATLGVLQEESAAREWQRLLAEAQAAVLSVLEPLPKAEAGALPPVVSESVACKKLRASCRNLRKQLPRLPSFNEPTRGEACETLVRGLSAALGTHSRKGASEFGDCLPSLLSMAEQCRTIRGGMRKFRMLLLEHARNAGAAVLDPSRWPQEIVAPRVLPFNGGRASRPFEVSFGAGETITAFSLVLWLSLKDVASQFGLRVARHASSRFYWFTSEIVVDSAAIPVQVAEQVIWVESDAPPLWIEIAEESAYSGEKSERKILFLRTPVSVATEESRLRLLAGRMKRKAQELFPFLEGHIIAPSALKKEAPWSPWTGEGIPAELRIRTSQHAVGVQSGVSGAWVCSREAFPQLGILGELLSSTVAISRIRRECAIRDRRLQSKT